MRPMPSLALQSPYEGSYHPYRSTKLSEYEAMVTSVRMSVLPSNAIYDKIMMPSMIFETNATSFRA